MSKWDLPAETRAAQPAAVITRPPIAEYKPKPKPKPQKKEKEKGLSPTLEADRQIALTGLRQIQGYKTWRDKPVMRLVLERAIHVLEALGGEDTR